MATRCVDNTAESDPKGKFHPTKASDMVDVERARSPTFVVKDAASGNPLRRPSCPTALRALGRGHGSMLVRPVGRPPRLEPRTASTKSWVTARGNWTVAVPTSWTPS